MKMKKSEVKERKIGELFSSLKNLKKGTALKWPGQYVCKKAAKKARTLQKRITSRIDEILEVAEKRASLQGSYAYYEVIKGLLALKKEVGQP